MLFFVNLNQRHQYFQLIASGRAGSRVEEIFNLLQCSLIIRFCLDGTKVHMILFQLMHRRDGFER